MRKSSKKSQLGAWATATRKYRGNRKLRRKPAAAAAAPAIVVRRIHGNGTVTEVRSLSAIATSQYQAHAATLRSELQSRTMAFVARQAGITKMMASRFAAGTGGQDAHTHYAIAYAMGYTLTLGQNPAVSGFRRMPAIAPDSSTKGA